MAGRQRDPVTGRFLTIDEQGGAGPITASSPIEAAGGEGDSVGERAAPAEIDTSPDKGSLSSRDEKIAAILNKRRKPAEDDADGEGEAAPVAARQPAEERERVELPPEASHRPERQPKPEPKPVVNADPEVEIDLGGTPVRMRQSEANKLAARAFQTPAPAPAQPQPASANGGQPAASPQPAASADQRPAARAVLDPARAKDIVAKLQYGTEDEAVASLQDIISAAISAATPTSDTINAVSVQNEEKKGVAKAMADFSTEFGDHIENRDFQALSLSKIPEELLAELKKTGITPQDVQLLAQGGQDMLINAYVGARILARQGKANYQLRDPATILRDVGQKAASRLGLATKPRVVTPNPTPTTPRPSNIARKRDLQPQPRAQARPSPAAPVAQPATKRETNKQFVQGLKAQRQQGAPVA